MILVMKCYCLPSLQLIHLDSKFHQKKIVGRMLFCGKTFSNSKQPLKKGINMKSFCFMALGLSMMEAIGYKKATILTLLSPIFLAQKRDFWFPFQLSKILKSTK